MADELISVHGVEATVVAKLLLDVCGPSARRFGDKLGSYAQAGMDNIEQVLKHAATRLKSSNKTEGQVPPRIIHEVFSQAYFCEDATQAAYLGGVLASSKGPISRDDRAIAYLSLINSLSTYQIRTHFILYSAILRMDPETFRKVAYRDLYNGFITVSVLMDDYNRAMDFSEQEESRSITQHSYIGLVSKDLIAEGNLVVPFQNGSAFSPYLYFYPTVLGMELFLWGCGLGGGPLTDYHPNVLEQLDVVFKVLPFRVDFGHVKYG